MTIRRHERTVAHRRLTKVLGRFFRPHSNMYRRALAFWLSASIGLVAVTACSDKFNKNPVLLPNTKGAVLSLKMVYVDNPRLEGLQDRQIEILRERIERFAHRELGLNVKIQVSARITVEEVFAQIPEKRKRIAERYRIDYLAADAAESLAIVYASILNDNPKWREKLFAEDAPLAERTHHNDVKKSAQVLATTHLQRLAKMLSIPNADGTAIGSDTALHEFVYWAAFGYAQNPPDIVVTNQLIASAEKMKLGGIDAVVGGVKPAHAIAAPLATYGMYAYWSMFPMISRDPFLAKLRDEDVLSMDQILDLSALGIVHEMGHVLLHLGHTSDSSGCVMNTLERLRYMKWAKGINHIRCQRSGAPEMTSGTSKFYFDWF